MHLQHQKFTEDSAENGDIYFSYISFIQNGAPVQNHVITLNIFNGVKHPSKKIETQRQWGMFRC